MDETLDPAMAEKIAAKFGFPKGEVETPETEAPQIEGNVITESEPETVEIEWEGGKLAVPSALKDAFMFNKDYTQKTQALAEQQRAMDHARELMTRTQMEGAFRSSVENETRELAVIDAYLTEARKMNWASMSSEQMMRTKIEVDQVRERCEAVRQIINEKKEKFQGEMNSKFSELRAKSRELAAKSIPGFSEETEKSIRAYAMTEGLSETEVDNVLLDPRSAKVLWKAMQFEKVQANLGKTTTATTKTLRPGATHERMPAEVAAKLNFNKAMKGAKTSGDKARVIEQRLEGMFAQRK